MKRMDEVFVSMTYGGSTLGVAAAVETISILKKSNKKLYAGMHALGNYCITEANAIAKQYEVPIVFGGYGPHPVAKILIADDLTSRIVKTYMYQEFNKAGILFGLAFYVSAAHTKKDIDKVLAVFDRTCRNIAAVKGGYKKLTALLEGDVVSPRQVRTF
jgi:glutamate-1-semialdehyde aminotransferase